MAGYQKGKLPPEAGRPKHCLQSNIVRTNTQRERQKQSNNKTQGAGVEATVCLLNDSIRNFSLHAVILTDSSMAAILMFKTSPRNQI